MEVLTHNQANMITFVMVDNAGTEVAGLGGGLSVEISKGSGAFQAAAGAQGEIGNGWYHYTLTSGECDTVGPISVRANGAGAVQQNLAYFVRGGVIGAIEFTYTVTETGTGNPLEGAEVWITTDVAGNNVIWNGTTDAFGVARDDDGELPWLDSGTYQFWTQLSGYTFTNPDAEVVS